MSRDRSGMGVAIEKSKMVYEIENTSHQEALREQSEEGIYYSSPGTDDADGGDSSDEEYSFKVGNNKVLSTDSSEEGSELQGADDEVDARENFEENYDIHYEYDEVDAEKSSEEQNNKRKSGSTDKGYDSDDEPLFTLLLEEGHKGLSKNKLFQTLEGGSPSTSPKMKGSASKKSRHIDLNSIQSDFAQSRLFQRGKSSTLKRPAKFIAEYSDEEAKRTAKKRNFGNSPTNLMRNFEVAAKNVAVKYLRLELDVLHEEQQNLEEARNDIAQGKERLHKVLSEYRRLFTLLEEEDAERKQFVDTHKKSLQKLVGELNGVMD